MSKRDWGPGLVGGVPHLPGGSVSPEIGEHPGEPVVDLVQGQLPVRSFQNGLWARKQQRDPQLGPHRVPGLCSLPQDLSLLPGPQLTPQAEETPCISMWIRTRAACWSKKRRLVTAQSETKGNTNLKGYVLVQRAHEFL